MMSRTNPKRDFSTLTDNPTIDPAHLRDLAEKGWSLDEIADELSVNEDDVERALSHHDIDYNGKSTGRASSGTRRTLWEMDPDDLGGDQT